jgi:hypothetical protein
MPGGPNSNVQGVPVQQVVAPVRADLNGQFSITLTDNKTVWPAESQWRLKFCPPANNPNCYVLLTTVTGATQDLSSSIQAVIPPIVVKSKDLPSAYNSFEINQPTYGSLYYDLNLGYPLVYNGLTWNPLAGTGTAPPPPTFVFTDNEIVNGADNNWTLQVAPNPQESLLLFQFLPAFGGILLAAGADYVLAGANITTVNVIPAGTLRAWYRY